MSYCKVSQNLIRTARRWPLFLSGLRFMIVLRIYICIYLLQCALFKTNVAPPNEQVSCYTPISPERPPLSNNGAQGSSSGEI